MELQQERFLFLLHLQPAQLPLLHLHLHWRQQPSFLLHLQPTQLPLLYLQPQHSLRSWPAEKMLPQPRPRCLC